MKAVSVRRWVRAPMADRRRRLAERPRARRAPRRLLTPVVLQLEATDCGAASLGIVLAHFGRWVSLEELRDACGVGRDGSNAADLVRAARRYGLKASGWRREIPQLAELEPPMILFWGFNHFLVLEGIGDRRYYLNDPATGHRAVDRDTFDRDFTGVVLTFKPAATFQPGGRPPGIVRRLWPWLRTYRAMLAYAAVCGLLLAVPVLAAPLLLSIFVDHVLGGGQAGWDGALIGAAAAAGALIYLLTWLQMRALRKLVVRLSTSQSDRYLTLLLRLPMRFFAHRYAGDLASRMQLIDHVASLGAGQVVGLLIELVMSLVFLALMLAFDVPLALVIAALGALCIVVMRVLARVRTDQNHRLRRDQGLLQGVGMAGLRTVDTLRATARENDFFARWSGHQATELQARQQFVELGHVTHALPALFSLLGAAVVFGLGGWRVMAGEMSVGMLMGFHVLAGSFLRPVGRFVQFSELLETLEADLQRLDDVFNASEDAELTARRADAPTSIVTFGGRLRLIGRLELRGVTFGYQRNRPPLIENLDLTIEPGQRVAVVGPSGSGKSTLALLAAGVHRPWSGEILFDGHRRDRIAPEVLAASVSIVDQHAVLFAGTVRDNLTMWNPATPDEVLIAAAEDAAIHEEIIARPLGYDSAVEEGGRNFSGGQRLRLEIARALVNNPTVLLLDEATSALDTLTELRVDDGLRRRNCTCLIVAHRLSTIRDADRIIVLDRGRVIEQGTHEELVAAEAGFYARFLHGQ